MATMTLDELVTQLQAAYGAGLVSVVLYGSAAAGEHIPAKSDYNVLVLLERVDQGALAAASAAANAWREAGNPPPMTMTVGEWRRSSDVFPMEYADILERHRLLFGAPPFDGVSVAAADLRLQLEQQALGKLLQLRQGALLAGTDGKRQLELVGASLSTILVIFRAVLRLHGELPSTDNVAVAERVARLAGFEAEPFGKAIRHARGEQKLEPKSATPVLAGYMAGVARLESYLDSYAGA